jgi:hypothetical protein
MSRLPDVRHAPISPEVGPFTLWSPPEGWRLRRTILTAQPRDFIACGASGLPAPRRSIIDPRRSYGYNVETHNDAAQRVYGSPRKHRVSRDRRAWTPVQIVGLTLLAVLVVIGSVAGVAVGLSSRKSSGTSSYHGYDQINSTPTTAPPTRYVPVPVPVPQHRQICTFTPSGTPIQCNDF